MEDTYDALVTPADSQLYWANTATGTGATDVLKNAADFVSGVATTYAGFVSAVNGAQAVRDNAATNRLTSSLNYDLANRKLVAQYNIEKLRTDQAVANAQGAFGSLSAGNILAALRQPTPVELIGLALAAVGVWFAWKKK